MSFSVKSVRVTGAVWVRILSTCGDVNPQVPCFPGEHPSAGVLSALFRLPITWAQLAFVTVAFPQQVPCINTGLAVA